MTLRADLNTADAVFAGVARNLLTEDSFAVFRRICPIHGRLYEVAHKPGSERCAACLEVLRETWDEPTKGAK